MLWDSAETVGPQRLQPTPNDRLRTLERQIGGFERQIEDSRTTDRGFSNDRLRAAHVPERQIGGRVARTTD